MRRTGGDARPWSGEGLHGGGGETVVLLRGAAADADGADQPAVTPYGHASGDEEQGPVEGGGQRVEEAAGLHGVDQLGGGRVQLERGVGLACAGLTGDEHGPVVPAEGEQVPAGVEDGDADGDPGLLGGLDRVSVLLSLLHSVLLSLLGRMGKLHKDLQRCNLLLLNDGFEEECTFS